MAVIGMLLLLALFSVASSRQWTAVSTGNWSDPGVWQTGSVPPSGASVVIPKDTSVLLDVSNTPALSSLTIDGGTLGFAQMDLHLRSHRIMLAGGGRLHAGTPERPFTNQLVITLLGNRTHSEEAPVYGAKFIAIAGGHLELYGIP